MAPRKALPDRFAGGVDSFDEDIGGLFLFDLDLIAKCEALFEKGLIYRRTARATTAKVTFAAPASFKTLAISDAVEPDVKTSSTSKML